LPIDEVMEGGDGAGLAGSRLVRRQASFDDIRSLGNARNLALQSRGLVAAGIARPTVPRRQGQQLASRRRIATLGGGDPLFHDLAVAVGTDRHSVPVVPGRKASLRCV